MTNDYAPNTEDARDTYIEGRWEMFPDRTEGEAIGQFGAEFDRWLTATVTIARKETADAIVDAIRKSCTPSAEVYNRGGDILILAVADWIETPPEWVNASWRMVGAGQTWNFNYGDPNNSDRAYQIRSHGQALIPVAEKSQQ